MRCKCCMDPYLSPPVVTSKQVDNHAQTRAEASEVRMHHQVLECTTPLMCLHMDIFSLEAVLSSTCLASTSQSLIMQHSVGPALMMACPDTHVSAPFRI